MDFRLVCPPPRRRNRQIVLWPGNQPAHRFSRKELRPAATAVPHSSEGRQGRLTPMRSQLLPAFPTRGTPAANDRHRNESHWLSMHHSAGRNLTGRAFGESRHEPMKQFFHFTSQLFFSPKLERRRQLSMFFGQGGLLKGWRKYSSSRTWIIVSQQWGNPRWWNQLQMSSSLTKS